MNLVIFLGCWHSCTPQIKPSKYVKYVAVWIIQNVMTLSVHYVGFCFFIPSAFHILPFLQRASNGTCNPFPFPQFTRSSIKAEAFAQTDPVSFKIIYLEKRTRMKEFPLPAL